MGCPASGVQLERVVQLAQGQGLISNGEDAAFQRPFL
jgi:hypothetical protein